MAHDQLFWHERSPLIDFGHCSVSKCVSCGHSGHSHISCSSQPLQHSSTIVNNHRAVWWAPECLSSETWLLHDAWEEGSGLFFFFFWLRDFKEDDSWQMHRSWWPLVLFEDLDWIGGWCSSTTCHLSPSQNTTEWTPEGVRHVTWPLKPCPSFSHSHVFYLISALLLENSRLLMNAFMVGGSSGPCEFPWEWLICPLLQKGDVVQPFHFLALPQQGSHMTWPTVNLDS